MPSPSPDDPADAAGPAGPDAAADAVDLLMQSARALRRRWMASLEPWSVSPHEFRALHTVIAHGATRLSDIADRLRIAPRSATEVIDSLEDKGLARRVPSPTDRRSVLVEPTESGRRLAGEVAGARGSAARDFLAPLSPAETESLRALLTRLLS